MAFLQGGGGSGGGALGSAGPECNDRVLGVQEEVQSPELQWPRDRQQRGCGAQARILRLSPNPEPRAGQRPGGRGREPAELRVEG